tara:strand:+ start:7107 stop:7829 length:723 start_codon:yes stop_codon:yes gene_type:complete
MSKKVLITGATGGLGYRVCHYFHERDYTVLGTTQDKSRKKERAESLESLGVTLFELDITDYNACEALINALEMRFAGVDVLVNNAGITADKTLKRMTPEQWSRVIDTNLTGAFNLTRAALPGMLERGYGRIVSVSSINGHKGQFGQTNYAASKAGLYGFTKSLAQETAGKGVTVNTVSPGYLKTEMTDTMPAEVLSHIVSGIPVNRLGEPDEVARVIEFLANEKSSFITGADYAIDGGQH